MNLDLISSNKQNQKKKAVKMMNLLLEELLTREKFVQEVTEANFLSLEQSCKAARVLIPYIRAGQLYLLSMIVGIHYGQLSYETRSKPSAHVTKRTNFIQ